MPTGIGRLFTLILGLVVPCLTPAVAGAATPLARSSEINFTILLQQTLRHSPEYLELAARDEEARLFLEAARSWIAGRPSLELSYVDDRPMSSAGMMELEYGVQVPLWRRGQRRDARLLGEHLGAQAMAWKSHLELTVAGRLRTSLADLDSADRLLAIERQATADARQLLVGVEKLFEAGEVAQLDVMQTRTLLLNQQRQELETESALHAAELAYSTLTGLAARPAAPHVELLTEGREISPHHPWLRLLQASLDVADDAVRQARLEARGNPSALLGSRRQRGGSAEPYSDSVILSLSVPFGGSAHVASQVGAVMRQRIEAEVQLQTARRELTREMREVERELAMVRAALILSEEQVALDRRQREMSQSAFELGEVTLFQVLTALRQARASARELETLKLRQERLITRFNQIIGVLP